MLKTIDIKWELLGAHLATLSKNDLSKHDLTIFDMMGRRRGSDKGAGAPLTSSEGTHSLRERTH